MFNKNKKSFSFIVVMFFVFFIFLRQPVKVQAQIARKTVEKTVQKKQRVKKKVRTIKIINKRKVLYTGTWVALGVKSDTGELFKNQLRWTSSNPSVATISSKGKIRAKKAGTTRIIVSAKNNRERKSFVLKVKKSKPIKSIKIVSSKKTLLEGETMRLRLKWMPANTTYRDVKWTSGNKKIAVVSPDGVVEAKKAGQVIIKAKEPFTKKTAKIRLKIEHIPVRGIYWNFEQETMEVGQKVQLSAQVTPENASNKRIIYSSSDKTKVSIDENGIMTALRPTEYVVIRAMSLDGKYKVSYTMKITKSMGYLTNDMLDAMNLSNVKKLMIVAHPDDETLWGGSHLIDDDYFVVCMSNGWHKKRSADFNRVLAQTGDPHIILDYPDVRKDWTIEGKYGYEMDMYSTCREAMQSDIQLLLSYKNWDEVVTHNPNGEYGKYHHQQVSEMVTKAFNNMLKGKSSLYYFGRYYQKGEEIPGKRISEQNLEIKNRLVNEYQPTAKGAIEAFGHMIPYENWVLEEDWK